MKKIVGACAAALVSIALAWWSMDRSVRLDRVSEAVARDGLEESGRAAFASDTAGPATALGQPVADAAAISSSDATWRSAEVSGGSGLEARERASSERPAIRPEDLPEELRWARARELAQTDPSAAAEFIPVLPAGAERDELIRAVIQQWSRVDVEEAVLWAIGLTGTLQEQAIGLVVPHFAETDPATAGELVLALAAGPEQTRLWDDLVRRWSGKDFDTALSWAKALPPGLEKDRALMQLSYRWDQKDPQQVLAYAVGLPEGQDQLVISLMSRWAQEAPQAVAEWVAALPSGTRKEKIAASVTAAWAATDPRAAAGFITSLEPAAQHQAAVSVVSAWAMQEPAAAAEWVVRFPPSPTRAYALENLVFNWARDDADAATAWLQRLPVGPERDAATGWIARASLTPNHPRNLQPRPSSG